MSLYPGPGTGARRRLAAIRIALIVFSIVLISAGHYHTGRHLVFYHGIMQTLYFLPIFAAALWFGLRGGVSASLLSTVLYLPHVVFQWRDIPRLEPERYLEILLFNVVGGLTGFLAGRVNRQRDLYRKTAEELETAYEELQRNSDQLRAVEGRLRQTEKISALGELSATIAHELMNPLGSFKGAIEILRDEFPPGHEKGCFLDILIKELDRLERTVRSILRFSRKESLSKTMCDPAELIDTILALTRGEARGKGVRVRADLERGGRRMLLDVDQMRQVLLNIVINAIQAMPSGGDLTVVSAWSKSLPLEMRGGDDLQSGEGLLLAFEDSGVGIPKEEIPGIFEPFYTSKEEGTGLGLAVVKKIIQAHTGKIRVDSTEGKGTRFSIWLPDLTEGGSLSA